MAHISSASSISVIVSGQGLQGVPGQDGSGSAEEFSIQVDAAVIPGTPVYAKANSTLDLAQANSPVSARVVGLVTSTTAAGFAATLRSSGPLALSTNQWDAITGQSGGLSPGASYYLDGLDPGILTTTAPSLATATHNTRVGIALNSTVLDIRIRFTFRL